jgi:hypothetical protein
MGKCHVEPVPGPCHVALEITRYSCTEAYSAKGASLPHSSTSAATLQPWMPRQTPSLGHCAASANLEGQRESVTHYSHQHGVGAGVCPGGWRTGRRWMFLRCTCWRRGRMYYTNRIRNWVRGSGSARAQIRIGSLGLSIRSPVGDWALGHVCGVPWVCADAPALLKKLPTVRNNSMDIAQCFVNSNNACFAVPG